MVSEWFENDAFVLEDEVSLCRQVFPGTKPDQGIRFRVTMELAEGILIANQFIAIIFLTSRPEIQEYLLTHFHIGDYLKRTLF